MVHWAVAAAFGWHGEVAASAGPRGALGQIWRVEVDGERYALKELFDQPPTIELVEAEAVFVERAVAAGVRAPRPHRDLAGRYLVARGEGLWARLYDWVDVTPLDLTAPGTPAAVGTVLARLHNVGAPCATEVDGSPADPWYEQRPALTDFAPALASGLAWVPRLRERLSTVPALYAVLAPSDPARLLLCHRDLHPGNVQADAAGQLVVVDWDNLGPADPSREVARALLDWWCDPEPSLPAMRLMYGAYLEAGGPGRITAMSDFTMLVAGRLNFLLKQLRIAADPGSDPSHRAWAEQEIDEALRILPTPSQLEQVLALCSADGV